MNSFGLTRNVPLREQQLGRAGSVPLGRRIGQCDDDGLVGKRGRQLEPAPKARRGIEQNPVELALRLPQHRAEGPQANRFDLFAHRRGEQREAGLRRVRRGLFDRRFAAHHRRERQRRFVGHAEGNVQIAQPDIEVDRQDAGAVPRQTGSDPRTEGRLSRAALSGDQRYDLSQRASLPQ